MDVPPHPHTGLQTVSWLFSGEVEHRDSAGVHAMIRPGELNLMTAGAGICHSEVSTAGTQFLHGVQLWVALPDSDRDTGRDFAHHVPSPRRVAGAQVRVFLGELAGTRSPVHTFTPLLGAQVDLRPGATVTFDVDPTFEHGVLLDQGSVQAEATTLEIADLWYQSPGHDSLALANRGAEPARVLVLGGPPFGEQSDHVVELRRPHPRRDRPVPANVAGRRRALRRGDWLSGWPAACTSASERRAAATNMSARPIG